MRIAVLTIGDPSNKKGAFNATHERIRHLMRSRDVKVEVFIIRYYNSQLARILRKAAVEKREEYFIYDDIRYNNLWIPFTVIDHALFQYLNHSGIFWKIFLNKYHRAFSEFDLVSAHSLIPAYLGLQIKKRFKIPFVVTWHGSEIHSIAFSNKAIRNFLEELFSSVDWNFFVSQQLLIEALKIKESIPNSSVLYNSANKDLFFRYSETRISDIKQRLEILPESLNVGFVGNLVDVKNVTVLPYIFSKIQDQISNINFHIVGDGSLKNELAKVFQDENVKVKFWGNQSPELIADYLNVFDLVLLPSKNEGMPLIVLECLFCQTPVLAAAVGGIPEILPDNFLIYMDGSFNDTFAEKSVRLLRGSERHKFEIPKQFTWEDISNTELAKYKEIVNKQYLKIDSI